MGKNGQFPDESVRIKVGSNSLCNLPDVLAITGINDTTLGGLLLFVGHVVKFF
jgi:hypothetical protein